MSGVVPITLAFNALADFEAAIERQGANTGFFLQPREDVAVGQRVALRVAIRGLSSPVFLDGLVAWRRVRAGGGELPAGVFVVLSDRDRARLDGLLGYLRQGEAARERRTHPRFPILLEATYLTSKGAHSSETGNLSAGGAFLRCSGPLLTIGATFPVRLFLDGPGSKPTELVAHVAWIDPFEQTKGMGVAFMPAQPALRRIHQVLRRFEGDLKRFQRLPAS
jgi:Tfp pilus assembly protein PilZ